MFPFFFQHVKWRYSNEYWIVNDPYYQYSSNCHAVRYTTCQDPTLYKPSNRLGFESTEFQETAPKAAQTRAPQVEKLFFHARNRLNSCQRDSSRGGGGSPPSSSRLPWQPPRPHWHSNKICVLICNLIGKPPPRTEQTAFEHSARSSCFPSFLAFPRVSEESVESIGGDPRSLRLAAGNKFRVFRVTGVYYTSPWLGLFEGVRPRLST